MTKEQLHDLIIEYYAGGLSTKDHDAITAEYGEEAMDIIALSNQGWDDLPCDNEGPTTEQNDAMEDYIDDVIDDILRIKK